MRLVSRGYGSARVARANVASRWSPLALVRRKHEPFSQGIETPGVGGTGAARLAERIGRASPAMGKLIERYRAMFTN